MKLDAHRLAVLKAVVEHGSMSRAAIELGFSTSAVSQQVAALERAAGVPLLVRHARGVRATAAGAMLVQHARILGEQLSAASEDLATLVASGPASVRLGIFASAAAALLPAALEQFAGAFPQTALDVLECDAEDGAQRLSRGELDVAVVFSLARTTGLDLTRLGDDRYRVLLPASHPAAAAASDAAVPLERLAGERWIMPRGAACSTLVADACRRAGFAPRVVLATDDHATARRLVAEGVGIAAVPALLGLEDDGDTVLRDTDPAPCRALHVALAARDRHPPELPALRDALQQAYNLQAADVERQRSGDPR